MFEHNAMMQFFIIASRLGDHRRATQLFKENFTKWATKTPESRRSGRAEEANKSHCYSLSLSSVSSKSSVFFPIFTFSLLPVITIGIPMIPNGGKPSLILMFNFQSKLVVSSILVS